MLSIGVRLKVIAFVVVALTVIAYIGSRYADLGRYVGVQGYYVVKVDLAETGGLFPNSNITYRGVSVGRVGALNLSSNGVVADLRIDKSAPKVPADARAVVANLSAVGEQYVDLRPTTNSPPYLKDGSRIARANTATPAPVTELLTSLNGFTSSVPLEALRTVVDELGHAFRGQGPNLQALMDYGGEFTEAADLNIGPTTRLIIDGEAALRTQNEEAASLKRFATNLKLVAGQLRKSDIDLRKLIAAAPKAAGQLAGLLRDVDPTLSVLLANLLTTANLGVTRVAGLEELLVKLPQVVAAGSTVVSSGKLDFGMATTFFNPLPCTSGYGGTTYRNGLRTTPGPPLNTAARCLSPAGSGVNVRGAANAPRGGVPAPSRPGAFRTTAELPGALGLPGLPEGSERPAGMAALLGLAGTR